MDINQLKKKGLSFAIFAGIGIAGVGAMQYFQSQSSTPAKPAKPLPPAPRPQPIAAAPMSVPDSAPAPMVPSADFSTSQPDQPPAPVVHSAATPGPIPAPAMPNAIQPAKPVTVPGSAPQPASSAESIPPDMASGSMVAPAPAPAVASAPIPASTMDSASIEADPKIYDDVAFLTKKLEETVDLLLSIQKTIDALEEKVDRHNDRIAALETRLTRMAAASVPVAKPERPVAADRSGSPGKAVANEMVADEAVYSVRPGDTLKIIADRHGVRWQDLARWNGLCDPDLIEVGMRLRLQAPKSPQAKPTCSESSKSIRASKSKRMLSGWRLIGISDGRAVIRTPKGDIRLVAVGQTLPGLGRVTAIDAEKRQVRTARGLIGTQPSVSNKH